MALIYTIASLLFVPASLADGAFEILLPKNTSLWVANGKARRVVIASDQGEIDTWSMEVTDSKGHTAHAYPSDIIFPQKTGGKSVYEKHVLVPETLKSGEYKLKICGSLKGGRKLCQKSDTFYIEGDQVESLHNIDDLQPHEKRFISRLRAFEDYLRKLDVEDIWPIHETHCTIPKIHKPSKEEFTEKCMKPGQACIITGMMDNWKAMNKWLFETFQHDPRIEDGVYVGQRLTPVPLTNYVKYLKERAANETAPWVIFMSDVFDLYPELREDYIIPDFFAESDDFMNNVEEELRLDWRWIIMAAKRSGSGWHVDPANTTGWLALVQGAKLWGMYPPSVYHIPGVKNNYYQKRDYDMEDAFYWWIYTRPYLKSNLPIECVQKPGDIVFIPTGWWHSVVNLDDTVSVTQNFCNKYSLRNCLTELREQADSDGGFIGRTFEQLRELYAQKYPQYFQQEDLDFEAPVKGDGLTEEDEKSRRLQALKDFLSGSTKTIV
ncbi:bifunctional arginine demethylase and lysyl-hydroxylase JMJD6-like [Stylophora pistillata]|nr:bifunctional arginine demethylase and lysyl-hydroxylase JMJD6-like [Stylophora pistillata]XP_022784783.1 bifunctional arginine demethylase and lysyl-hydroxylase JMJD6-like [Stylophora pistillata]